MMSQVFMTSYSRTPMLAAGAEGAAPGSPRLDTPPHALLGDQEKLMLLYSG
jgi:hypothetical protein